MIGGKFFTDI
jgi:hypothetical protein